MALQIYGTPTTQTPKAKQNNEAEENALVLGIQGTILAVS
jgi:hypothetical protein